MTPSATTAAGRASAGRATPVRAPDGPAPNHRRQVRQRPAPHAPRRVSGPLVRRARAVPAPRHSGTLGMRALGVVRALPEHSLIDRLVRGRAWIPVLGVLLAGIVAMQVEVLKLGNNIGHWVQRSTTLQSQNESLQASVASLNDDQRIERLAAGMGMVMPAPTTIAFLSASGGDTSRAIASIHTPDPTGFAYQLAAQVAAAAAAQPNPPSTATTSSTATTTAGASGAPATSTGAAAPTSSPTAPSTATTTATPQGAPSSTTGGGAGAQSPPTGAAALAPATSQSSGSTGG